MESGQKLAAIKYVREAANLGLLDAKTWVENYKSYDLNSPQYEFKVKVATNNKDISAASEDYYAKKPVACCNKWVALFLCIYFGVFGAHRFYEGDKKWGKIYLFTFGLVCYGMLFDVIRILFKPTRYPKK